MSSEPEVPSPTTSDPAPWLTPGRFAGLLALLLLAMFPGVILGRDTFVVRDFGLFSLPVAHFQRECFWRGELPLWNPLNSCGLPFLAQWNTMCLYPPALVYLLLPLTWSLPMFCFLHLLWGGCGMYRLARGWTNHSLAAGLAGVLFAFNGLSLNFLMWPSHSATFSWLPWVIWLGQRAIREGGRIWVLAALAGAMQMLAGGPETIFITWFVLGLLTLGECLKAPVPRGKLLLRFVGLVGIISLLCAAQLLPFFRLLSVSQRDSGFQGTDWPMPPWGWASFLVPLFRTAPNAQGLFLQIGQYWTSSYYTGAFTVILVACAIGKRISWRVWLLFGLLVLGLVLAPGNASVFYRGLKLALPALETVRYPVKFVLPILIAAAPLAAWGLTRLEQSAEKLPRRLWVGMLLGIIACAAILLLDRLFPLAGRDAGATLANGVERVAFILLLGGLTVGYLRARERLRIMLGVALLFGVWLDLYRHVPTQNPVARPEIYSPGWASRQNHWETPPRNGEARVLLAGFAQEALRHMLLPDVNENYLLSRKSFFADCNLLEDVPQIFGFFSLSIQQPYRTTMLPYHYPGEEFPALLDFMSVRYTTVTGKVSEWNARPTAMPMATAGQRAIFAEDEAVLETFFETNLNFREIVFLPLGAQRSVTATQHTNARVLESRFSNQEVSAVAEASAPSLVVFSQSTYPAWRAYVDGKPTALLRANYAFQAVEIPAGQHSILLKYEDREFSLGAWLSAGGILLCAGLWIRSRRSQSSANLPPRIMAN